MNTIINLYSHTHTCHSTLDFIKKFIIRMSGALSIISVKFIYVSIFLYVYVFTGIELRSLATSSML